LQCGRLSEAATQAALGDDEAESNKKKELTNKEKQYKKK
jgi:hypothetical protein